ncbi:hypothetical protein INR49_017829 [Caranx melampygus]|nr:hypothetical protein INR49_017829 [Caranx melampygus]
MVEAMPNHDSSYTTVPAGVSPSITAHTGFVRRIPNRATGADTGDTHLSSAQAHSPPTSRLPPRVLVSGWKVSALFLMPSTQAESDVGSISPSSQTSHGGQVAAVSAHCLNDEHTTSLASQSFNYDSAERLTTQAGVSGVASSSAITASTPILLPWTTHKQTVNFDQVNQQSAPLSPELIGSCQTAVTSNHTQTAAVDGGRFSPPYHKKVTATKISPKVESWVETKDQRRAPSQGVREKRNLKMCLLDLTYLMKSLQTLLRLCCRRTVEESIVMTAE